MTALTLIPSFASNQDLNNKGTSLPPWNASSRSAIASLASDTSNWWSDSHSDVFYSIQNLGNNFDVEFQYGQNLQIWASAKFIKYSYVISNEVINADNSITFDLTMTFLGVVSNKTSYANAGVSVQNRLYLGSQIIMARDGNTKDTYQISINSDNPVTFKNITLSPRASFNSAQLQWGSTYPNHEYPNAIVNIGMLIFNPLYAWYVPMMTRKNSAWLPLNGNAGKILRRVNHYIAYAYSVNGTDRFTTVYPMLNMSSSTKFLGFPWYIFPTSVISKGTGLYGSTEISLTVNQTNNNYTNVFNRGFDLSFFKPSTTYTFSFYCKGSGTVNSYIYASLIDTNKDFIVDGIKLAAPADGNAKFTINGDYTVHTITLTTKSTISDVSTWLFKCYGNVNITICLPKIEEGLTATPWMPSDSEVQPSDYPSYYGSYYGQGTPSKNASDYSWSPMVSPIPQNEMGWSDFSIDTQGTENQVNKGHNRRRTAGQFLQLPKLN